MTKKDVKKYPTCKVQIPKNPKSIWRNIQKLRICMPQSITGTELSPSFVTLVIQSGFDVAQVKEAKEQVWCIG